MDEEAEENGQDSDKARGHGPCTRSSQIPAPTAALGRIVEEPPGNGRR